MKIETKRGSIVVSQDVIAGIVAECANNCFGVGGMANKGRAEGLARLLKRESYRKGVRITQGENSIDIELHILVRHGINIAAVGDSILSEIRYKVEKLTGIPVGNIDLCVDGIMTDD